MKTTLITTIFNEEDSIEKFIDSILSQSVFPDEVVVVDAKSSDKTLGVLNKFIDKSKYKKRFKILSTSGNRSKGRNLAIKNSRNEIIICSDGGCILDKDWVKNIIKPFENKYIDVSSGFYLAKTSNVFQKSLSTYTCVMPEKIDPENFLPSSRSVAFKKSAWEKVGGYPEWLDTCEDLVFDKELKKIGANFKFSKNAIVYWPQRKNLIEAFNQFFGYSKGDGEARYLRPHTPFLFLRYFLGLSLAIYYFMTGSSLILFVIFALFAAYLFWAVLKNYKYVNEIMAIIYLPILQLTSDIAVILGMSLGLLKSLSIKK